jgi:oxidase EvaA
MNIKKSIANSSKTLDGPLHSFAEILEQYKTVNSTENFKVSEIGLSNLNDWFFDESKNFSHISKKFFKVTGAKNLESKYVLLLQNEIGTLGLLSCIHNDIMHFLIQFKKEPGNIVSSQLSPTLQATVSNQQKVHGGKAPKYLENFTLINDEDIIAQQNLPEQGNRYWKKLNNNIIVLTEYQKEQNGYTWMTLGQIYKFMEIDNSINSCLRSVLSLINIKQLNLNRDISSGRINKLISSNIRKFSSESSLENSVIEYYDQNKDELFFKGVKDEFYIKGISISIQDREVGKWHQPIIYDPNLKEYSLVSIVIDGKRFYLLKIYDEIGYKDGFIFGPTFILRKNNKQTFSQLTLETISQYGDLELVRELKMSEEGGRFLHTTVNHSFYELRCDKFEFSFENFELFDEQELNILNNTGYLSMEARSLLFLSNSIYD